VTRTELRPLGIRDILAGAFRLYQRRFATFAAISTIAYLPYAVVVATLTSLARRFLPAAPEGQENGFFNVSESLASEASLALFRRASTLLAGPFLDATGASLLGVILLSVTTLLAVALFLSLVYPLGAGALVVNISGLYLGEELSAAESFRRVFRRLGHLLLSQSLATLVTFVGFVCFFVPGVLCLLWFALVPAIALLEDQTAAGTLRRSRSLMAGNLGRAVLLGATLWLIAYLAGRASGALIGAVPWPVPFVGDFLDSLVTGLVLPLQMGAVVLFYYDLRIRKEGFDLQFLASHMDASGLGERRGP
jgi:hypothetical protein